MLKNPVKKILQRVLYTKEIASFVYFFIEPTTKVFMGPLYRVL
jgi:hypothetical protein